MAAWHVVIEVELHRRVVKWALQRRIELDAIQRVLRADGPAGLDWAAHDLAGAPTWEAVQSPVERVFMTAFRDRVWRVWIEVRPNRIVIIRRAEHFVSAFWR